MGYRSNYRMSAEDDPGFAAFWAKYPRRVSKKDARKAWAELRPDAELVADILAALEWQAQQPQWLKDGGAFIPYPASWLRAERWEDEPTNVPTLTAKTSTTLRAAADILRRVG